MTDIGTGDSVSDDLVVKFHFCNEAGRTSGVKSFELLEPESIDNMASIDRENSQLIFVEVFDVTGKRILRTAAPKGSLIIELRNMLPSGIYFLMESTSGQKEVNTRKVWID